jgi:hypothetical protein
MSDPDRIPLLTGGCQCGAIRYALFSQPRGTICHCRMCQKAVGGPFAAFASLPAGDLAWTSGTPALFRSSSLAERGFCPACGTPLTYAGLDNDKIDITIGSLDTPAAVPPQDQYGAEGTLPWFAALATLPAVQTETKYAGLTNYQHPDR